MASHVPARGQSGLTRRTSRLTRHCAFSLIEIMVVVALLTVIILGLLAMFDQTERAFRLGLSQTDILESGRTVTEMIGRELSQMTPCDGRGYPPLAPVPGNNYSYYPPNFSAAWVGYSVQPLPATVAQRTNVFDDVFFLTRQNQTWSAIGYFVRADRVLNVVGPVGTLYRFQMNCSPTQLAGYPPLFSGAFSQSNLGTNNPYAANVSKIMDGVVDFKVRALSPQGYWITNSWPPSVLQPNICATNIPTADEVASTSFYSNAVPAFVELEVGVLERKPLQQYLSIPNAAAQFNYFTNQAAHVHIFRQRIAIPNVDPAAYPTNGPYAPY